MKNIELQLRELIEELDRLGEHECERLGLIAARLMSSRGPIGPSGQKVVTEFFQEGDSERDFGETRKCLMTVLCNYRTMPVVERFRDELEFGEPIESDHLDLP